MSASIQTDGAVLLRSALPANDVNTLRRSVERTFSVARLLDRFGLASRHIHDSLVASSMSAWSMRRFLGRYSFDATAHRAMSVASKILGPVRFLPDMSLFRCQKGSGGVNWHIDADAANTAQFDPCFNVWVPLCPVGGEKPSIEFVLGSHKIMRGFSLMEPSIANRTDDWVRDNTQGRRWVPEMNPGDVVIFDHYLLHRTQPIVCAAPRASAEFRVSLNR